MYNRSEYLSDPWLSSQDHAICRLGGASNCILYGEDSYSEYKESKNTHEGADVYIKQKSGIFDVEFPDECGCTGGQGFCSATNECGEGCITWAGACGTVPITDACGCTGGQGWCGSVGCGNGCTTPNPPTC